MSNAQPAWDDLADFVEAPHLHRTTGYMYGVDSFQDGPCARSYDPWEHADMLDLPVIFRDLPDENMVAAYSHLHGVVFVRPNLHSATERCALTHEIVHFENHDVGTTKAQEDRADRIAARRLIRPSQIDRLYGLTEDPAVIALELNVTEKVMRTFMRMVRQGRISRYA